MSADLRTLPQRLADAAPYLGVFVAGQGIAWWGTEFGPTIVVAVVAFGLATVGVERSAHYRGQRDRYRRSLVALVTKVEMDQVPAYFAHLVPADVLAEAFPKPTPVPPRSVSEGCGSNHREADNDR